ncbi:MAG TPA: hypothetical protein VHS32_15910 [Streptosporangiaceae bacterium]|nr:hypothetical protein [Streptosporangiaceae bacterium]
MQAAPGEDGAQGGRRVRLEAVLAGPGRELGGERRPGRISAVDVRDIAAALTSALGRDITFVDVPPAAFAESLQGILPPWQI